MRINYIYIYVPRPARPGPPAMPPEISESLSRISACCGGANMPPELKEKMDKIRGLTARILGIIDGIKSPGLQAMLRQVLQNVLAKAEGGNLDGAIQDLNTLVSTCERISDKVRHCQTMCSALAANVVPGPAGSLLQAIAKVATEALAGCTDENGLDEITRLLERSMELMSRLNTLKPTDAKYQDICKELKAILGALSAMEREDPYGPGMGADELLLAADLKGQVGEAMATLKGKALMPGEAEAVEALAAKLEELADLVGKGGGPEAQQKLNELLHLAAKGQVKEALQQAQVVVVELSQVLRRKAYSEGLLERLDEVVAKAAAKGAKAHPALGQLEATVKALKEQLRQAGSPEALHQIEEQLREVLQASRCLLAGTQGMEATQAARTLAQVAASLDRGAGGAVSGPGSSGSAGPGMGSDAWSSGLDGPSTGGASRPSAGGPGPSGPGAPSGTPASAASAGSASSGSGPAGLASGASSGGPSAADPWAGLQVPAVSQAIQREGTQLLERCWRLASHMEGPAHDPLATALQGLSQSLSSGIEDEGMLALKRLKLIENAMLACQNALPSSPEASRAQSQLLAVMNQSS